MRKAHRIRLNPTPEQENAFRRAAGIARFAWNWSLAEYQRLKTEGKTADWNAIKKEFRARIDTEFPFVREVTKCAPEEAIADLRRAIGIYYQAKPKNPTLRFPKPRKRSQRIGGFGLANDKFRVAGHTVCLPKIGVVNMAEPLRFAGKIVRGRVTERAGHWFLTVVVDVVCELQHPRSASVGIDFGLSRFATLSNGEVVETQACFRKSEAKLKRLQRGLARKQKGSQNRKKWKQRVTRFHERVRNQRQDFLQKFTTQVVEEFGIVFVEDLNLRGLCRTRLAKSFHDAGIGEAVRQMECKQVWQGGALLKVDRFFPSSKRCHVCFRVNHDLTLEDREWRCKGCGTFHDRDLNAARNLEIEGILLLAGSGYVGVTPVELLASTSAVGGGSKSAALKQELEDTHLCVSER
jgi:IS605 OrfB family transposase